jgi:hypothetical protein
MMSRLAVGADDNPGPQLIPEFLAPRQQCPRPCEFKVVEMGVDKKKLHERRPRCAAGTIPVNQGNLITQLSR